VDDSVADALDAGQPPQPAVKFISQADLVAHISEGTEASLTPRSQGTGTGRMMTAIAVTIIIFFTVFITGVVAGVIGVISVAVHRTERNHTLTLPAADPVTQTGRWLNGVYVRTPVSAPASAPRRQMVQPARDRGCA
jgi:hypothetical protein